MDHAISQTNAEHRDPILALEGLTISFGGVTALDGVTFCVYPGEILGLIGPNGAGKTTVFNCITGVYRPQQGAIRVHGRDILTAAANPFLASLTGALARVSPSLGTKAKRWVKRPIPPHNTVRLGIARTFQNVALFPSMTVLDNLLVGQEVLLRYRLPEAALGLPPMLAQESEAKKRCLEMLAFLGMEDEAHRPAGSLPFPRQKRVELARALLANPHLLLLDEPAGGLNHEEVRDLAGLIKRIKGELGCSVLLVEHHMELVMGVSDRVVVLDFGRKIAEGDPASIATHPAVVEAYLGTSG